MDIKLLKKLLERILSKQSHHWGRIVKHEKRLNKIERQLYELTDENKRLPDAIGRVVETRETDGSMSELAFADEQACGCSRESYYESLVREEKLLGPKKKREYPHE